VVYSKDVSLSSSVEWKTAEELEFPTITVCYPKYFTRERMQSFDVDDDLANYLTMALDLTGQNVLNFTKSRLEEGEMEKRLLNLEKNLSKALKSGNFSDTLTLFNALTVK